MGNKNKGKKEDNVPQEKKKSKKVKTYCGAEVPNLKRKELKKWRKE